VAQFPVITPRRPAVMSQRLPAFPHPLLVYQTGSPLIHSLIIRSSAAIITVGFCWLLILLILCDLIIVHHTINFSPIQSHFLHPLVQLFQLIQLGSDPPQSHLGMDCDPTRVSD
jgi:hypothetical protein